MNCRCKVVLVDDPGTPVTITPEGLRALEQAKRWRRDRWRRRQRAALYVATFVVAFALGTAAGLVLH